MNRLLLLLFMFCLIALNTRGQFRQKQIPTEYGYIVQLGQTAPDFDIVLTDNRKISIRSLRGKVVMLQFTASWCSVCRKEMPYIERDIWQRHKKDPDFALYGIDLMEEKEKVLEFQKQIGTTYPLTLDEDGRIFYSFAAENAGVTRNVILNKEGIIVYMTRLFNEEEFAEMKEIIDELLNR